jgi:hypothetical protein
MIQNGVAKKSEPIVPRIELHHGRIIFEGPDELFWKSNDPVIREFVEYDTAPQ